MDSQIEIKRESEFYQGFIRLKMSISNKDLSVITDVTLDFIFEDNLLQIDRYEPLYEIKNSKVMMGNIKGGMSTSIAVYFDPLMCTKSAEIGCQVNFSDSHGKQNSVFMEPKHISVICPIIKTDFDINVGRLKEFIEKLPSKDSKVYEIQQGFHISKIALIAREVLEKHDVRHVRTLKTKDDRECEIWYYGRTKVTKDDIVIRVSISSEKHLLELFAATETAEALTGLLAELGRDLKYSIEHKASGKGNVINVTIRESVIQRSNLIDLCSMEGACPVNILVEDSVLQHTTLLLERNEAVEEEKENFRIQKYSSKTKAQNTLTCHGIEFILVPAGEFIMGSLEFSDSEPIHKVKIKKPFYMSKYPVTQRQWKDIIGRNPSKFKGNDRPVERVSWSDVQEFIKKLNNTELANKYRLPSEAEWEYACRASTTTRYFFGDDLVKSEDYTWYSLFGEYGGSRSKLGDLGNYAWYLKNSGPWPKTHPVGQKKPNPWGLYDMHGNVWEWVQDRWHSDFNAAPSDGSAWEDGSLYLSDRVIKGGSWGGSFYYRTNGLRYFSGGKQVLYSAMKCRSAFRGNLNLENKRSDLGFRLVMEI